MITTILTLLIVFTPYQSATQVSAVQKNKFIKLLKTLPHKGEFYTDEAVKRVGKYLPVLLALNEKDIEKYDIYPFVAISRGLCDDKKRRVYAVRHFAEIRHPLLKLSWGIMLFNAGDASPEIVWFLQDALASEAQSKLISEMVGPDFEDFKRRVLTHHGTSQ